jgi:hypothetical protein
MNWDIRIGRSARFNGTVTFLLYFALVSAAHADLATYRFTSRLESPSGDGFLEGFVTFDASLREPGDVGAANFLDWGFTWGSDFTYGPTTHSFDPAFSEFVLADDLSVLSWSLCFSVDGICRLISHPVVLIQGFAAPPQGPASNTVASTSPAEQIGNSSGDWDDGTVLPEITADLTVTRAILQFRSPSDDEVDLRGQFLLTEDGDGIVDPISDPISETVVIEVESSVWEFRRDPSHRTHQANIFSQLRPMTFPSRSRSKTTAHFHFA